MRLQSCPNRSLAFNRPDTPMLQYDILTHLVFLVVDGVFLVFIARISRRPPKMGITVMMLLGLAVAGLGLSNIFYLISGLRSFAMLRSVGHFLFWHLPFCLFVVAFLHRRSRVEAAVFLGSAGFLLATYFFAYHIEPYRLDVTRYEFEHPSLAGLERPILIAQVADIQTDRTGSYERKVLETLAELSPDLIIYCGDFVQISDPEREKTVATDLHALIQELVPEPPFGSYAVLGDVDSPEVWTPLFQSGNIRLMTDETVELGLPGVKVDLVGLGVGTSHSGRPENLKKAFSGSRSASRSGSNPGPNPGSYPERLKIVFGHGPDYVARLDDSHAPFLALAGHTHGGQVRLPFVGPLITFSDLPRHLADAYEPFAGGFLSVSRGIGMERLEAPRLRFLCRPELRLITLKPPGLPGV